MFTHFSKPPQHLINSIWTVPWLSQSGGQSGGQSGSQSGGQSGGQSRGQSGSQSGGQSGSQLGGQSVGESVSQYLLTLISGFIPRPVQEVYVVGEGSLGHVFTRYLGLPLSGSFYGCSIIIFSSPTTASV